MVWNSGLNLRRMGPPGDIDHHGLGATVAGLAEDDARLVDGLVVAPVGHLDSVSGGVELGCRVQDDDQALTQQLCYEGQSSEPKAVKLGR
jgi:hypothetical protein